MHLSDKGNFERDVRFLSLEGQRPVGDRQDVSEMPDDCALIIP